MTNKMNAEKLLIIKSCIIGFSLASCATEGATLRMQGREDNLFLDKEALKTQSDLLDGYETQEGRERSKKFKRLEDEFIRKLRTTIGYKEVYRSSNAVVNNFADKENLPPALVEGQGLYDPRNMKAYKEFTSEFCPEKHRQVVINLLCFNHILTLTSPTSQKFYPFDIIDFLELCRRVKILTENLKCGKLVTVLSIGSGPGIYENIIRICFMGKVLVLCVEAQGKDSVAVKLSSESYGVDECRELSLFMGGVDAFELLGKGAKETISSLRKRIGNVLPEEISGSLGDACEVLIARNIIANICFVFEKHRGNLLEILNDKDLLTKRMEGSAEKVFKAADLVYMSNDLPGLIEDDFKDFNLLSGKFCILPMNIYSLNGTIGFSLAHKWPNKVEGFGGGYFGSIPIGCVNTYDEEEQLLTALIKREVSSREQVSMWVRSTVFLDNREKNK